MNRAGPVCLTLARRATVWVSLGVLLGPGAVRAQGGVGLGGDLLLQSKYNWRGITRSHWSAQADVFAAASIGPTKMPIFTLLNLSAGAWANIELANAGQNDLADRGELGFSEINPWAQVAGTVSGAQFSFGFTRYLYHGSAARAASTPAGEVTLARSEDFNTSEFFWRLAIGKRQFRVTTTWWLDVDVVGGSYFETAASLQVPFIPFIVPPLGLDALFNVIDLRAAAGWSAGQEFDASDPRSRFNFARSGLTHVDFSLATHVLIRNALSIEPRMHVQVSRDSAARRVSPGAEDGVNVWFGLALSPIGMLGR